MEMCSLVKSIVKANADSKEDSCVPSLSGMWQAHISEHVG
jgi:hypothetical protein